MATKLLYLTDNFLKETTAKIVDVKTKGNQTAVILNQTIFYPLGGGQPSDQGTITTKTGSLAVSQVTYNQGQPLHFGKLQGKLTKKTTARLTLDWPSRFHHMCLHSAGHIVHEAVMAVSYGIEPIEGMHGIKNELYVKYQGIIDRTLIDQIQDKVDQIIADNLPITTQFVSLTKLQSLAPWVPANLPKNKPLRVMQVGSFPPIPDGGTQVASTADVGKVKIVDIDYDSGCSIVRYQVFPAISKTPSLQTATDSHKFISNLNEIVNTALAQIKSTSPDKLPELQIKYLGKKGLIGKLTKEIVKISADKRSEAGQKINVVKKTLTAAFAAKKIGTHKVKSDAWLDVTAPGKKMPSGHLHPLSQAIEEITRIFEHIGFTRVRYPEVDWDWYVFESLNMPHHHPARDEFETFFVTAPTHPKLGQMVLTTHTSNGQVREMQRVHTPPIRMINIAKCYRRQQDLTHTAMFHQFEGLVIDKGINIQHLKGTIDYFARHFYGPKAISRLRPFHFQFTEPSFEVDFSCTMCAGKGCKFCKSGWHEVGGAGMVHPNVLKAGGIDPTKYTGFAFGWGIERTYTLKPGLKLDDIRLLYSNNLEFLEQF